MIWRRLRAAALMGGVASALASGCGNKNDSGPPSSPCDDLAKAHPPFCGSACKAKCGCRACADGSIWTVGDQDYLCQGNCLQFNTNLGGAGGGGGAAGSSDGRGGRG